MRRALIILTCLTVPSVAAAQTPAHKAAFDSAYLAWDAGRYDTALQRFLTIVRDGGHGALLEPIALITGEWFRATGISTDGRSPRWSPDSRYFAYETGSGTTQRTHVVQVDAATGTTTPVAEVPGHGLVFAPDGRTVAYLAVNETPELVAARAALERLTGREAFEQRQRIALLEIENARIVLRELPDGGEHEVEAPGLTRAMLAYTADGTLVVAGGSPGQPVIDRVMRLSGEGAPVTVPAEPLDAPITAMRPLSASRLLIGIGREAFGIVDVSTGQLSRYEGESPSPTADGNLIVFLRENDDGDEVHVLDVASGATRIVKRADVPLASPALSPDGRRVAFQMMPRENWEVYMIGADGEGEVQITREIQHDLRPHFLSNDTLFALMGEGRHRRSYVYDLRAAVQPDGTAQTMADAIVASTPGRVRVHHNNQVRTVAPEYDWAPSPDGRMLLVVADRDGDTISPERGLTLLDLTRHVSADALAERIETALAAEQMLRTNGAHAFAPIQPVVADAVADVATARIYGYANDLFQFDSKFITQPGNQKAIEYIAAKLRAWGYEPELQWFEARGVRTANIIAKLPGTVNPELIYVVSSHFDSVARGPGADDDSSGTTALLEAARVLKDRPQPATIHFAFFTGEEAGLLGSREYVRRAVANGDRIVGALNNDMIGFANDHRLDNTIRYSNAGIRDIQHAAAILFTDLITYDAKYYRSTDAAAYYEAYGDIVGGIGSYPILGSPHYHQSHDVLETIDQQLVAEVSKTTIATLMLLASSPARLNDVQVTRRGTTAEVTWAAAPESGIREYIVSWGAPDATPRTLNVSQPSATIEGVAPGDVVRVKAMNERGLASWDWAVAEVST